MTQQEEFGRRLRQLRREKSAREERDIEQGEVAAAIGDNQPNVARWEKGRIPKEDATLERLAAYYGVTVYWLRFGKGERHPQPKAAPAVFTPVIDPHLRPATEADAIALEEKIHGKRPAKKASGGGGSSRRGSR